MGKTSSGTTAFGRRNKRVHTLCRRCGRRAFNITKRRCAACGFGASRKIRVYSWVRKSLNRQKRLV
jgi:large subunit ribosomal protein L37e